MEHPPFSTGRRIPSSPREQELKTQEGLGHPEARGGRAAADSTARLSKTSKEMNTWSHGGVRWAGADHPFQSTNHVKQSTRRKLQVTAY